MPHNTQHYLTSTWVVNKLASFMQLGVDFTVMHFIIIYIEEAEI